MEINHNYLNNVNSEILPYIPSIDLIDRAKRGLIDFLEPVMGSIDPQQIHFKEYEWVIWPDTAMGVPESGKNYAQVTVAGYRLQFEYQEKIYTIHIDLEGSRIVSPDFVQSAQIISDSMENLPSIFDLSAARAKPKGSSDIVTVKSVKRFSDLDQEKYYFEVVLNNEQTFQVPVSLDDLVQNKISVGMHFQLTEEKYVSTKPGLSTFTYTSLDGSIQLINDFDSINSHWVPTDFDQMIELTQKWVWRSGMSNINYSVKFSDGTGWNVGADVYNSGIFNLSDKFFKVQPNFLVNKADGRVIDTANRFSSKFIKVTWSL